LLADVITAILAELNRNRSPRFEELIGERHIHAHGKPPRLVWVPTTDSFEPPVKVTDNPRALRTRVCGVECHAWGANLRAAELIVNDVCVAVHRVAKRRTDPVCYGYYELRGLEWVTAGEFLNEGVVGVLRLEFRLDVADALSPTALVTSAPIAPNPA
jgi:hypothetical protein